MPRLNNRCSVKQDATSQEFFHSSAHLHTPLHTCTLLCTLAHWHKSRAEHFWGKSLTAVQNVGLLFISRVITARRLMSQKGDGTECCRGCKCWPVLRNWGRKRDGILICTKVMANQWKHFAMSDFLFQLKINSSPIAPIAVSCAQAHLKTCNESTKKSEKQNAREKFYS